VARDTGEGVSYEVAHEALLKGWAALRKWLDEHRESRAVRQRLEAATAEWLRLSRHRDALWGPKQIAEVGVLEAVDIGAREAQFIEASRRALQRRQQLRRALALLVPIAAALLYAGYQVKQKHDLRVRVDHHFNEATSQLQHAKAAAADLAQLRKQALALYDSKKREAGDAQWGTVLEKVTEVDELYAHASQEFEAALTLDGFRDDIRDQLAHALYERAIFAESDSTPSKRRDLLARLALYDRTGALARAWNKPARIQLSTNPAGAAVSISQYSESKSKKFTLTNEIALGYTPLANFEQSPGSYLITINRTGYAPIRYPILLRRGEDLSLSIDLLAENKLPKNFVHIPAGRFLFGSNADEGLRISFVATAPLHERTTGSYLIGRYEVTIGEWLEFLRDLSPAERQQVSIKGADLGGVIDLSELPDARWQLTFKSGDRPYTAASDEPFIYKGRKQRESQNWLSFPVTGPTLAMAQRYATWLRQTGRVPGARLCTEYEWERAGRGADGREFPNGNALSPSDANYDETYGKDPLLVGPDEVGSHPASMSPFGVFDITGNAAEWMLPMIDASEALLRSGGWFVFATGCRVATRYTLAAGYRDATAGFRICADVPR
ncbi:MAG TPA: SUMF1/EgtB/PvdO family nonheme iron enzyme, partial [Pseudomonadota bacterium]|nr:SUMF1/EgtB/PvdO family nonheme iron enzyme [Pseudomonadota bacterium]